MSNKGYYGWIHSLNQAALEAQKRGFEIINENFGKARKVISPARRTELEKGLQKERLPRELSGDIEIFDDSGRVAERHREGTLHQNLAAELADRMELGTEHKVSPVSVSLSPKTDVGEYIKIRRGKHAEILAKKAEAQRASVPVDVKPIDADGDGDADANDAAAAAHAREQDVIPSGRGPAGMEGGATRQPNFPIAALARMEAGHALPGDPALAQSMRPVGQHEAPLYSSSEEANKAATNLNKGEDEIEHEEDEDTRHLGLDTHGMWSPVRESVSEKINRFLNG